MGLLIVCIAIVVGWAVAGLAIALIIGHVNKGHHASPLDQSGIRSEGGRVQTPPMPPRND